MDSSAAVWILLRFGLPIVAVVCCKIGIVATSLRAKFRHRFGCCGMGKFPHILSGVILADG